MLVWGAREGGERMGGRWLLFQTDLVGEILQVAFALPLQPV